MASASVAARSSGRWKTPKPSVSAFLSRKRTFAVFIPVVLVMVAVDQATKGWAASSLQLGKPGASFGLFEFDLVHNAGAAFGLGQGAGLAFVGIALLITVLAIVWLAQKRPHGIVEVLGLSLVVAGGIGNCINRLLAGYVVDFIKLTFIDFPVFNVADICVTCGVALFLIAILTTSISSGTALKGSSDEDVQRGESE